MRRDLSWESCQLLTFGFVKPLASLAMPSLLFLHNSGHFRRLTITELLLILVLVCGLVQAQAPPGMTVADKGNYGIQEFLPNSTSVTAGITVAGGNGSSNAANPLEPSGVSVNESGIFAADSYTNRIQKFPLNSTSATPGITIAGGNDRGSAANQLDEPSGVFVDASGAIYAADFNNHRIQKFLLNTFSLTGQPPASAVVCTASSVVASVSASGPAFTQRTP